MRPFQSKAVPGLLVFKCSMLMKIVGAFADSSGKASQPVSDIKWPGRDGWKWAEM